MMRRGEENCRRARERENDDRWQPFEAIAFGE